MVKLIGPALGQAASGSLAGALTFSSMKGRAYVKSYKKPRQPRSQPQMAMRAGMSFLSDQWGIMSTPYRNSWNDLATHRGISPFNAFQGENLSRIRAQKPPSVAYPATEVGNAAWGGGWNVYGGVRSIKIELTITQVEHQWGYLLWNVTGNNVQPAWSDLIGIMPTLTVDTFTFDWTQHTPGTYWITFSAFTRYGLGFLPCIGWLSAVVTG